MLSPTRPWRKPTLAVLLLVAVPLAAVAAEEPVPPDKAVLVVRLPKDATLTIGGDATRQTGAERTFVSPPLKAGKTYTYELKATWREGGESKTATREVTVRSGERTVVDFNGRTRAFLFTYAATVNGLKPGEKARVWIPVPPSDEAQQVKLEAQDLPAEPAAGADPEYGNKLLFLEAAADRDGRISLSRTYRVVRREVSGEDGPGAREAELLKRFLHPDRLVPIDGKPLELIKDRKLPKDQVEAARVLYDAVNRHMRYDKTGTGWGRGDAVWACDSRHGNCSDFHSLFIALARAEKIPAKFVIGFPLPEAHGGDVAGYHCWALFRPEGKGWIPVDISEANKHPELSDYYFGHLTPDRVAFSTGRDLTLVPKQAGPPLNFFIYPYVEVGGRPYPAEKVKGRFSYKDLE
jgi:uncharacterized protein (TIGR03000 family)